MRQIKFRAYTPKDTMVYDVIPNDRVFLVMLKPTGSDRAEYELFDAIAIMQFTGLLDKNGVDAWEGDIVERVYGFTKAGKNKTVRDQIIYLDNEARFKFYREDKNSKGYSDMYGGHKVMPWEVIGNVYQSPELLKENSND